MQRVVFRHTQATLGEDFCGGKLIAELQVRTGKEKKNVKALRNKKKTFFKELFPRSIHRLLNGQCLPLSKLRLKGCLQIDQEGYLSNLTFKQQA